MDKKDLIRFFDLFGIEKEKIDFFLQGKFLVEKNGHIFLREEDLDDDVVYEDNLLFITLQKTLPSRFLLEQVRELGGACAFVKSEQAALMFTYGKDVFEQHLESGDLLSLEKHYLLLFEDSLLGYGQIRKENGTLLFRPLMNIGEYLRE